MTSHLKRRKRSGEKTNGPLSEEQRLIASSLTEQLFHGLVNGLCVADLFLLDQTFLLGDVDMSLIIWLY